MWVREVERERRIVKSTPSSPLHNTTLLEHPNMRTLPLIRILCNGPSTTPVMRTFHSSFHNTATKSPHFCNDNNHQVKMKPTEMPDTLLNKLGKRE